MIIKEHLEPLELSKQETVYMVPLIRSPDKYEVYVGQNYTRIFTDKTLPSYMKRVMALIEPTTTHVMEDDEVSHWDLYICRVRNMEYTGWRASKSIYIIVLDEDQLKEIKGEHD